MFRHLADNDFMNDSPYSHDSRVLAALVAREIVVEFMPHPVS